MNFPPFEMILALFKAVKPVFINIRERYSKERRKQQLLKEHIKQFNTLVHTFDEFMGSRRGDNIPYHLNQYQNHGSDVKHLFPSLDRFSSVYFHFKEDVEKNESEKKPDRFMFHLRLFDALTYLYHETYIIQPISRLKAENIRVSDDMKKQFLQYRRRHEKFIEDYETFANEVNRSRKREGDFSLNGHVALPLEL